MIVPPSGICHFVFKYTFTHAPGLDRGDGTARKRPLQKPSDVFLVKRISHNVCLMFFLVQPEVYQEGTKIPRVRNRLQGLRNKDFTGAKSAPQGKFSLLYVPGICPWSPLMPHVRFDGFLNKRVNRGLSKLQYTELKKIKNFNNGRPLYGILFGDYRI